uniref:Putative synaptojanin (N-terminal domain) n=1 Tax=Trypanosoma vivax (strain Y486) TaxID=1055687 RepID=G0TYF7_TRYVY|nr:putative synaptojanin (N-terminal domain), fragment [Trypanosoma vivax Y486]
MLLLSLLIVCSFAEGGYLMQLSKAPPRKRFALAVKNGVQILLLVLPRPHKPPPPSELEPLLFFDSAPQQDQTQSISQSKGKGINKWAEGSFVIPLVVNPNGELRRCRDLPKEEFQDLREAHRLCGPFECFTEYPAIFGALLLDKLYFLVAVTVEDVATAGEPSMICSADREEVLRGCKQYLGLVMAQLTSLMRYDSGGGGALSGAPRLRCINMLRHTAKSDEETLMKHYTGAVDRSAVAVRQQFPNSELVLSHVDWLNLSREQGIDVATRSFWEVVLSFFSGAGLDTLVTVGLMNLDGSVTRKMVQTSFVRVNCADSLDRTNIGCFYTCFQATVFMLTALGVETHSFADQRPLPPLDEQCDQGRGASSRAQSPNMRVRESPFGVLLSTWKEARNPAVYPAAIGRILAELHVYNGDTVAQLYTSSAAMHANILRGICGAKAGASNMVIATQRRYENVFEDEKKNRNIELLLGRNITAHFPSLSRAFLTRPVPLDRWCCTLTASDLPAGVQSSDIDHALRKAWDDSVVPHLHRHGAHQIPSSALIFSVTVRGNGTGDRSKSPTAASKSSPNNFKKSPVGSNAEAGVDTFNMAVIEFDPDLCHQLDVPTFLQQFSLPKLGAHILTLSPYSYPLLSSGNGQSRSLLEKAGSSLRSGLKNFVRGLNA